MAKPSCPKCDGTNFAADISSIENLRYNYNVAIIKCASCGTAIGVLDVDLNMKIDKIIKHLDIR
jgi:hypothetical protein